MKFNNTVTFKKSIRIRTQKSDYLTKQSESRWDLTREGTHSPYVTPVTLLFSICYIIYLSC